MGRQVLHLCLLVALLGCLYASAAGLAFCDTKNVAVSRTVIDGRTSASRFVWLTGSAKSYSTIFMLTDNSTLYRSIDGGRVWEDQNDFLPEGRAPGVYQESNGGVRDIITNTDKSVIYFLGYDGRVWYTTDGGANYILVRPTGGSHPIEAFQTHPSQPGFAALIAADPCCYLLNCKCTYRLYWTDSVTNSSWRQVDNGGHIAFPRYLFYSKTDYWWGFGEPNTDFNNFAMVYLYYPMGSSGDIRDLQWGYPSLVIHRDVRLPLSAPGNTYLRQYNTGAFFYDNTTLVVQAFNSTLLEWQVMMSHMFPPTGPIVRAMRIPPPPDAIQDSLIRIIDFSTFNDGAVWITTQRFTPSLPDQMFYSNDLYVDADTTSTGAFTFSLQSLHQEIGVRSDLTKIQSVDGGYMANFHPDRRATSKWASRITWNKGARWDPIRAPAGSCAGCSLHLLQPFSGGMVKSATHAPGIVLANGVVGTSGELGTPHTFISKNGGVDWTQVPDDVGGLENYSEGYHFYDIAEHGAIVAMIKADQSDHIAWTNDTGINWDACQFHTEGEKDKILEMFFSDPNGLLPQILLLTRDATNSSYEIWQFDFTATLNRNCEIRDYENWYVQSATADTEDTCLMGRTLVYRRKKPETACANADLTGVLSETACTCTAEDFICGDCFVRSADGKSCDFQFNCIYLGQSEAAPPAQCPTGTTYIAPVTGYDKIAGSKCVGGLQFNVGTRELPCPEGRDNLLERYPWLVSPGAIAGAAIGTLLILLLLVGLGFCVGRRFVRRMDLKAAVNHANFNDIEEEDDELSYEARTSDEPTAAEKNRKARNGIDDSEDVGL